MATAPVTFTRRSFLRGAAATTALGVAATRMPAWVTQVAFGVPGTRQSDILVSLFLRGGMDGLSAVVPVSDGPYFDKRPTIAVPAGSALPLDSRFGLHPALQPLMAPWQAGRLAIVHAAGNVTNTRSHFTAQSLMDWGVANQSVTTGWVSRHLASRTNPASADGLPGVSLGSRVSQSLAPYSDAVAISNVTRFDLSGFSSSQRPAVKTALGQLYVEGPDPLRNTGARTLEAIQLVNHANPGQFVPQNGAVYPSSGLGSTLKQVAQLIRAEVGLEVVCCDAGGWDTHENMGAPAAGGQMHDLLADLGGALGAFYTDLAEYVGEVCVVVMTEFGRTLDQNGSGGTDHGRAGVMFAMGGGVRGGQVYGGWPGLADSALDGGDLAVANDFRNVLAELVQHRLANPNVGAVFPGLTPAYLGLAVPRA